MDEQQLYQTPMSQLVSDKELKKNPPATLLVLSPLVFLFNFFCCLIFAVSHFHEQKIAISVWLVLGLVVPPLLTYLLQKRKLWHNWKARLYCLSWICFVSSLVCMVSFLPTLNAID